MQNKKLLMALLGCLLLSACGSEKTAPPFQNFEPNYAIFGTYESRIGPRAGLVGSVMWSSDPNMCENGKPEDTPYIEISLFSVDSNSIAYTFKSDDYPISGVPGNSLNYPDPPVAIGAYTYLPAHVSLQIGAPDGSTGHVEISNLTSSSLDVSYDITLPKEGSIVFTGSAIYCPDYSARLQARANAPLSQPG